MALQIAVGWVLYRDQRSTSASLNDVLERSSELLSLIQRAGIEGDPEVAVRVAVDGLRDYFHCDRVYLGWTRGLRLALRAVSGVSRDRYPGSANSARRSSDARGAESRPSNRLPV